MNDICLALVLFMAGYNYPLLQFFLLFLAPSIYALSGIPGKKCGVIILTAEELSNCRVSIHTCTNTCTHTTHMSLNNIALLIFVL